VGGGVWLRLPRAARHRWRAPQLGRALAPAAAAGAAAAACGAPFRLRGRGPSPAPLACACHASLHAPFPPLPPRPHLRRLDRQELALHHEPLLVAPRQHGDGAARLRRRDRLRDGAELAARRGGADERRGVGARGARRREAAAEPRRGDGAGGRAQQAAPPDGGAVLCRRVMRPAATATAAAGARTGALARRAQRVAAGRRRARLRAGHAGCVDAPAACGAFVARNCARRAAVHGEETTPRAGRPGGGAVDLPRAVPELELQSDEAHGNQGMRAAVAGTLLAAGLPSTRLSGAPWALKRGPHPPGATPGRLDRRSRSRDRPRTPAHPPPNRGHGGDRSGRRARRGPRERRPPLRRPGAPLPLPGARARCAAPTAAATRAARSASLLPAPLLPCPALPHSPRRPPARPDPRQPLAPRGRSRLRSSWTSSSGSRTTVRPRPHRWLRACAAPSRTSHPKV
jgi:hypothetical protein